MLTSGKNFSKKHTVIITFFILILLSFVPVEAADVNIQISPSEFNVSQEVQIGYSASNAIEPAGTVYSLYIYPPLNNPISNCNSPAVDIDPGLGGEGIFTNFTNSSANFITTNSTSTNSRSLCIRLPDSPQQNYSLNISTTTNDFGALTIASDGANQVNVTALVYSCDLNITIYPEKRIPSVNNWDTLLDVQIYNNQVQIANFQVPSNNFGIAHFPLCLNSYQLTGGNYDFYIRGFSHLRRRYTNLQAFNTQTETLDLRPYGEMYAGETSAVFDNYINVLDISTQVSNMYTNSIKNDLNQDNYVNTLDISNTITNFYISGQ